MDEEMVRTIKNLAEVGLPLARKDEEGCTRA